MDWMDVVGTVGGAAGAVMGALGLWYGHKAQRRVDAWDAQKRWELSAAREGDGFRLTVKNVGVDSAGLPELNLDDLAGWAVEQKRKREVRRGRSFDVIVHPSPKARVPETVRVTWGGEHFRRRAEVSTDSWQEAVAG